MNIQVFRRTLAITSLFVAFQADAQIYQWTDEDGTVHFSDEVPVQQRDRADAVELSRQVPDEADIQSADDQAERIRNAAEATAQGNRERRAKNNGPEESPAPASKPRVQKQHFPPLPPLPNNADWKERQERYELEMARYRASMRCFAPFRNRNGSFKGEAYELCEVVRRPKWPD